MKLLSDLAVKFNNPNDTDSQNIRALLEYIQKELAETLDELEYVGVDNNNFTRMCLADDVNQYMQVLEDRALVQDFNVVCDQDNNSSEDIDAGRLNVDIYLQPFETTKPIDMIELKLSLTSETDEAVKEFDDIAKMRVEEEHEQTMGEMYSFMAEEIRKEVDTEIVNELVTMVKEDNLTRAMKGV